MKSFKTIGAISVMFYPPMVSDRTCREVDGDALSGRFLSQERECSFLAQSPENAAVSAFIQPNYIYAYLWKLKSHSQIHPSTLWQREGTTKVNNVSTTLMTTSTTTTNHHNQHQFHDIKQLPTSSWDILKETLKCSGVCKDGLACL